MALFTIPELASFVQQDLDTDTATLVADNALGVLQALTGQTLLPVVGDVVTLLPLRRDNTLTLPQRPVNNVTNVTVSGSTVTGWTWDGDRTIYSYFQWGWGSYWGAFYPRNIPRTIQVTVTYDHGYTVIPSWLKGAALKVAGHLYLNPEALKQFLIDDYTAVAGNAEGGVLDSLDLKAIRNAGTRGAFSIRTS